MKWYNVNVPKHDYFIFFFFKNILHFEQYQKCKNNNEQAGAELCQAQEALVRAKLDLPIMKLYLSSI